MGSLCIGCVYILLRFLLLYCALLAHVRCNRLINTFFPSTLHYMHRRVWPFRQDFAQPVLRCNFDEEQSCTSLGEAVAVGSLNDFSLVLTNFLTRDTE